MGCRSDYMEPDKRERESREAAQHICYIYKQMNKGEPPAWAKAAAANTYGETGEKTKRDIVGALCDLLKGMDPTERDDFIYGDSRARPRRRLADWWERHLEADASLARERKKDADTERLRASAAAKLTPEERRASGL